MDPAMTPTTAPTTAPAVTEHRYPSAAILADYRRAGIGFLATAGPLAAVDPGPVAGWLLGGCAILLAVFGLRAALRHRLVVICTADGIEARTRFSKKIAWRALRGLELRYYATKRDRTMGWMQLTLKGRDPYAGLGGTASLRLESTLDGFDALTRMAVRAAQENDLLLSPTTLTNLEARGIKVLTPHGTDGHGADPSAGPA